MRAQAHADPEKGRIRGEVQGQVGIQPTAPRDRGGCPGTVWTALGTPGRAGSQPPGGKAPREKPGSRPSPAGQLAARGPGLNSPDENANLQLAGSVKQIRGNKTGRNAGKSPANRSLGCFQNKREGGARMGGWVPAREGWAPSAPPGPPRSCAPGPARLVTRVRLRLWVGGGEPPGPRPRRAPRGARDDHLGTAPRPARTLGGEHVGVARASPGTQDAPAGRTMTAAAVTWAPGGAAAERSPGVGLSPAHDRPLPAVVLLALWVSPRARPPPSLRVRHAPPWP